jgi:hypothetical protein
MRTATVIFAAVLTAAALGPAAYGAEPAEGAAMGSDRVGFAAASAAPLVAAPLVVAGDNAPDPVAADALGNGLPATGATAEIPPAEPQTDPDAAPAEEQLAPDAATGAGNPSANTENSQEETEDDDSHEELPPRVYSLQDFVNQGVDESPLGIEVREDCSKLATNEKVCGLAVLDVRNGSPADKAGIKHYTALTHDLLDGASVAAALVFPPAIVAVAVIDDSDIGETFDLVIGVDGRRVRHILDFQDVTSEVRAGDTVYLTIVRGGKRLQLPVTIPAGAPAFRN